MSSPRLPRVPEVEAGVLLFGRAPAVSRIQLIALAACEERSFSIFSSVAQAFWPSRRQRWNSRRRRHKGRRSGFLGLAGEDFEDALAVASGTLRKSWKRRPSFECLEVEGERLQPANPVALMSFSGLMTSKGSGASAPAFGRLAAQGINECLHIHPAIERRVAKKGLLAGLIRGQVAQQRSAPPVSRMATFSTALSRVADDSNESAWPITSSLLAVRRPASMSSNMSTCRWRVVTGACFCAGLRPGLAGTDVRPPGRTSSTSSERRWW